VESVDIPPSTDVPEPSSIVLVGRRCWGGDPGAAEAGVSVRIIKADCMTALPQLAAEGFRAHAVVTDPPYHLTSIVKRFGGENAAPVKVKEFFGEDGESKGSSPYLRSSSGFMGQQWDGGDVAFRPETWRAVFECMLPGAFWSPSPARAAITAWSAQGD
jgi:hypothetical protein